MRLERRLIAALLIFKLLLLAWNVWVFDGETYDQAHHLWRARSAGWEVGKMAYNGPLYYLATAPWVLAESFGYIETLKTDAWDEVLLFVLRCTNLGWMALFYTSWIYGILPRVVRDERTWVAASAVLLSLTGYQKVGTLVHPDNMLAALTAFGFACWLAYRELPVERRPRWGLALAVLIGVLGSVRPFALVPIGVLFVLLLRTARVGTSWRAWIPWAVGYSAVAGILAGAWLGYRAYDANVVLDAYRDAYIKPFEEHREGFDFPAYFTRVYPRELYRRPNRNIVKLYRGDAPEWENPYGNSFPTIAYSEFWGDHWLYLSGPRLHERKLHQKRRVLVAALPYSLVLGGRWFWGMGLVVRETVQRIRDRDFTEGLADARLAMLGLLLAGLALYLYWQTGDALLPGKHSTIKFLYNAHLVPFGIALAFVPPVARPRLWLAVALGFTALSVPYLAFVPLWMT